MNYPADLMLEEFYIPQPVQVLFHESKARYPLMEGGRGGGKSTSLLWEAIHECVMIPGVNALILRRTLTAMEKGGAEDLFSKMVPKRLYRSYNASKHMITFHNGSKLFFGHIKTDSDLIQYQGAEFVYIGWEELTQFTFRHWDYMKGSNRCPVKEFEIDKIRYKVRPRMAAGTNPNGKGSAWVKALWITKKPTGEMALNYDPDEYEAIHSTYADNYVYSHDANYIRVLHSIVDPVLRGAWLPGDWNVLAGAYFQNWDPERHVKNFGDCAFAEWEDRWISVDWGFEHATAVLWWTRAKVQDELMPSKRREVILCYRQAIYRHKNEQYIAERICEKSYSGDQAEVIKHVYLSPDRFSKIDTEHSIADNMGDVFVEHKLPRPERANNRRVDGWRLIGTLLDTDGVAVLDSCPDVIESLPRLMRDEKDPEDAESEGSDLFLDVCEAFRYGLMSYATAKAPPREVQMQQRVMAIEDPTQKYMEYLKITSRPALGNAVFSIPRGRRR